MRRPPGAIRFCDPDIDACLTANGTIGFAGRLLGILLVIHSFFS
jgi:hypothetical protein